ncbi:MAG TPA: T9SS type A sorting domain-containing protein [Bacteroidia bacterium]|nr:T9SS type A sorting domain-containing protein [Bacteroidia bacterium]
MKAVVRIVMGNLGKKTGKQGSRLLGESAIVHSLPGYRKLLACIFILQVLAISQSAFGQAPYLGGMGDGYAQAGATVSIVGTGPGSDSVTVFPNLVAQGDAVNIAVMGLRNKLEILVHDALGKLIWREAHWDVDGSKIVGLQTSGLAAGVYWIEVRRDGVATMRKLVVQGP